MFISHLKDKLLEYDKYGQHRTNGLKIIYLLILMLFFELFSSMFDMFVYYLFIPIFCFSAEIAGNTLQEKYFFLAITVTGAAVSVFLFGIFSEYRLLLVFFVFLYSSLLYYTAIYNYPQILPCVSTILALGSYSLIYENDNVNIYLAFNHFLYTMAGLLVMCCGLLLFPKKYYWQIWRRGFCDVLAVMTTIIEELIENKGKIVPIYSGIVIMHRYSKMVPKNLSFKTLKITYLAFELILSTSYLYVFKSEGSLERLLFFKEFISKLSIACKQQQVLPIDNIEQIKFNETRELKILYRLILNWNGMVKYNE